MDENAQPSQFQNIHSAKALLKRQLKQMLKESLLNNNPTGHVKQSLGGHSQAHNDVASISRLGEVAVAKYLRDHGLQYTLSVFLSEAGVYSNAQSTALLNSNPGNDLPSTSTKEMLDVWNRLEEKYQNRLSSEIAKWQELQAKHLQKLEARFSKRWTDAHEEFTELYTKQLSQLRAKETELIRNIEKYAKSQDRELSNQRQNVLSQIRQLDRLKSELQNAEEGMFRHQQADRARLEYAKEELKAAQLQLKQREAQLTQTVENAVMEARYVEQEKYDEKLQAMNEREVKLKESLEQLKHESSNARQLKTELSEKQQRVEESENLIQQHQTELQFLRQKVDWSQQRLRDMNDYQASKQELGELRMENNALRDMLAQERLKFEQENRELTKNLADWKRKAEFVPRDADKLDACLKELRQEKQTEIAEYKRIETEMIRKLEAEKQRYDTLFKEQQAISENLRLANEEIRSLRVKASVQPKTRWTSPAKEPPPRTTTAAFASILDSEDTSLSTTTTDSTPDNVKEARKRLQQMEAEAQEFDARFRMYERGLINVASRSLLTTVHATLGTQAHDISAVLFGPTHASTPIRPAPVSPRPGHQYTAGKAKRNLPFTTSDAEPVQASRHRTESITDDEKMASRSGSENGADAKNVDAVMPKTVAKPSLEELKAKENERKQRDLEERQRQAEELKKLEEEAREKRISEEAKKASAASKITTTTSLAPQPDIDPVMQQYMEMVKRQREEEAKKPQEVIAATTSTSSNKAEEKADDDNVEVASLERPSSSDFEW